MTTKEIFELRKQGFHEEAYEAAKELYAYDKGPYTSLAMYWTAYDILKKRINEGRIEEAEKIFAALKRMLPSVPDKEGWVSNTFNKCQKMIQNSETRERLQSEGPIHLQTGIWGEELAAAYLREKGYIIIERDWHSGHRDIDIIALQNDTVIFVEVKTRRSRDFADPIKAVNYKKQQNLLHAINHYLQYKKIGANYRFDVITIVGTPGKGEPEIEHIQDFQIPIPFVNRFRRRS